MPLHQVLKQAQNKVPPENNTQSVNAQTQIHAVPVASSIQDKASTPYTPDLPEHRPELDAEFLAIDLPSGCKFYDFKQVYIKTFKQKHLRKIIQGQMNKNPRYIAEVMNSCLECDKGYKDVAFRLCQEDFHYLQYWERLHSFPHIPYMVRCTCTNPEHVKKVASGEWPRETLTFSQQVNKLTLETKNLPEGDYDFSACIPDELKTLCSEISLHVPFMADYLDMLEAMDAEVGQNDDEGVAWLMTGIPASMLTMTAKEDGHRMNFHERFEAVDNLSLEAVMQLRKASEIVPEFGVVQTINAKCPRCGASSTVQMVLDAYSFLPGFDTARYS